MARRPFTHGIDEVQIAVHVLILDQRTGQDNLRDQHHRNRQDRRLAFIDQSRDDQPYRYPHRGEKHRQKDNPKYASHRKKRVAHQVKRTH